VFARTLQPGFHSSAGVDVGPSRGHVTDRADSRSRPVAETRPQPFWAIPSGWFEDAIGPDHMQLGAAEPRHLGGGPLPTGYRAVRPHHDRGEHGTSQPSNACDRRTRPPTGWRSLVGDCSPTPPSPANAAPPGAGVNVVRPRPLPAGAPRPRHWPSSAWARREAVPCEPLFCPADRRRGMPPPTRNDRQGHDRRFPGGLVASDARSRLRSRTDAMTDDRLRRLTGHQGSLSLGAPPWPRSRLSPPSPPP
jgi:hypothetical protein